MKFKKLKLINIRSYERQEIIFPDGAVLLSGEVGSGKTSILLAIEFAIFGLQPGQKGSSLLRNQENSGEVVLEFEISGKNIIIERKLRRSGTAISTEYSAISIDGEKFELSTTEVKTRILSLLGYPQEFVKKMNLLYRYTVYTPQEQMKQIILEDPEVRLNIIRHIFGMDKYKRIKENLSLTLNYLKEESKELQGEIRSLDEDRENVILKQEAIKCLEGKVDLQSKICKSAIEFRKIIEKESKELENKIKEKESLENEVEKTKIMILTKNESISTITNEISSLQRQVSKFEGTFSESLYQQTQDRLIILEREIEKLNSKQLELASLEKSLERTRKEFSERKERFFDISFCPTCLQNVPAPHRHNILNESENKLSEIRNQLISLGKEIHETLSILSKKKEEKIQLEKRKTELEIIKSKKDYIDEIKNKILEYQKQKISLEKDIQILSKHAEGLKEEISKFNRFTQQAKLKQDELKSAFLDEKKSEIYLAELNKEMELTKKEILSLESTISQKEETKKELLELLELIDWLSNQFRAFVDYTERSVLLKLRIEFSKLFNEWFHVLAGTDFEVQLDENFTPLIMQGETEMEYQFLSGGERTAVALAYRLALNQTINSLMSQIKTKDLVILDEPTEGFSETQIDKIRDVLEELKVGQLIIVSHEQKIEGFVDHVLRFRKEMSKTEVEKEEIQAKIQEQ